MACDDEDPCTQVASCQQGICIGDPVGADSDADGFCDAWELLAGCNLADAAEIPPQAAAIPGLPGALVREVLMNYAAPATRRVRVSLDPSCQSAGTCGPRGLCTAGRIADPCTGDVDCDASPGVCRLVVNYASVPGLAIEKALLNRVPVGGFTPATPGCSRKVDVILDPTRRWNRLRLVATSDAPGRRRRDRDRFLYRP
jgi:hypothetical protein